MYEIFAMHAENFPERVKMARKHENVLGRFSFPDIINIHFVFGKFKSSSKKNIETLQLCLGVKNYIMELSQLRGLEQCE